MVPPIHAVIVGINNYPPPFSKFTSAVGDARKIAKFLKEELRSANTTLLEDSAATKGRIIESISSLASKANRGDAIFFFFSGASGQTVEQSEGGETTSVGVICPFDVSNEGGISDKDLLQTFDQLSKLCGNNITVFLDCVSTVFSWDSPTSCVIVAPDVSNETPEGGAFTQAVIKVLSKQKLDSMTVQSFSGHIQAAMDDVEIRCVGSNVGRPLFNVKGDKGHHALIAGRTLKDGRILLCAGAAHGVRLNAIYGIYPSNIGELERLGELYVEVLNNDDVTATLLNDRDTGSFTVPPFFYAAEEQGYFDLVKISFVDEEPSFLEDLSGWDRAPESSEASITLQAKGNTISFKWNGLSEDTKYRRESEDASLSDRSKIQREIRRAARFHSHLVAPSPDNSSVSGGLQVKFQKIDTNTDKPTGGSLLDCEAFDELEGSFVELESKKGETLGPYSLTIFNDNTFPVWVYVFMYDPERFTIVPWYLPPPGAVDPPLAKKSNLIIGCDENERRIMLGYRWNRDYDFLYLKIFVTRERTDFTFFMQWFRNSKEDKVRAYDRMNNKSGQTAQDPNLRTPAKDSLAQHPAKPYPAKWASARITILQKFIKQEIIEPSRHRR